MNYVDGMTSYFPKYSAWRRLWDAGSATLLVHIVLTIFAYCMAAPAAEILKIPAIFFDPTSSSANASMYSSLMLESIRLGWPALEEQSYFCLGISALYLLVTPFFSMLWLCSMARPGPLRLAVSEAARRYHIGLFFFALYGVAALFAVAVLAALPWLTHIAMSFTHNERARDLAALAASVPGALLFLFLSMLHDGSLSALAAGEVKVLRSLRLGLTSVYRLDRAIAYIGWRAAALLLTAAGLLAAFPFPSGYTYTFAAPLILSQLIAFCRTLARGRWLASLVT